VRGPLLVHDGSLCVSSRACSLDSLHDDAMVPTQTLASLMDAQELGDAQGALEKWPAA
jgi:hypothetical protein